MKKIFVLIMLFTLMANNKPKEHSCSNQVFFHKKEEVNKVIITTKLANDVKNQLQLPGALLQEQLVLLLVLLQLLLWAPILKVVVEYV